MKTLWLGILILGAFCCAFSHPAYAATDTWKVGPNCKGVQNTAQHMCEFVHTQVIIANDGTPYDQWDLIFVEPGVVTDVTCRTEGPNIFRNLGAAPPPLGGNKANPWTGSHYGNVGICRGWINGGNGPVTMTVTYQQVSK